MLFAQVVLTAICAGGPFPFESSWTIAPGSQFTIRFEKTREFNNQPPEKTQFLLTISAPQDQPENKHLLIVFEEPAGPPPDLSALGLTADDMKVEAEFLFAQDMSIVGLQNWTEVKQKRVRFMNAIHAAHIKLGNLTKDQSARVKAVTLQNYADELTTAYAESGYIAGYFLGYEWSFLDESPIINDSYAIATLTGETIPAVMKARVTDDPDTKELIEYSMSIEPQAEAMDQYIELYLQRLTQDQLPTDALDFRISELFQWSYNISSGVIESAMHTRIIQVSGLPDSTEIRSWKLIERKADLAPGIAD